MSKDNRTFDLEERLIDFAVRIIRTVESLPKKENFIIRNSLFDIRYPKILLNWVSFNNHS